MRKLLKILGIVATTVVLTIVALAIIGFSRPRSKAHAAQPPAVRDVATLPTTPSPTTTPARPTPAPVAHAKPESNSAPQHADAQKTGPTVPPAPTTPSTSPFIRQLDDLEAQGKHTDAALLVFDQAPSLTPAARADVIACLKDRTKAGFIPAMYWLARVYFLDNNVTEAARWYAAAALSGRIDAARLADKTAAGAVPGIEAKFVDLKHALATDATLRRDAFAWALTYEESIKDRSVATWIAAHGLAAFKGGPIQTLSDDQWQLKRQALRDDWKKRAAE